MMIGNMILLALGVMSLVGLGALSLRDFRLQPLGAVVLLGVIVGLNLIPTIKLANLSFSVGVLVFYVANVIFLFSTKKIKNSLISTLITLVTSGILYGFLYLGKYNNSLFWGTLNFVYAMIIGFVSALLTKNAKYAFVTSSLSILLATLLSQIGGMLSLNTAYSFSIISGTVSILTYTAFTKVIPKTPSKLSYCFEMGKMYDDKEKL